MSLAFSGPSPVAQMPSPQTPPQSPPSYKRWLQSNSASQTPLLKFATSAHSPEHVASSPSAQTVQSDAQVVSSPASQIWLPQGREK